MSNIMSQSNVFRDKVLLGIVLVAFVMSFAAAYVLGASVPEGLRSDDSCYHALAVGLVSDHSYESTAWAPGYPVFLALIYRVAGQSLRAVYFVQAILFAVSLLFVYKIAFFITRKRGASLLATAACIAWLPLLFAVGAVMTEILSAALIAAALWYLMTIVHSPGFGRCAVVGLLLGAASLTKAVALPLIGVAALFVLFAGQDKKRRVVMASVLVLASMVLLAPWSLRNKRVTGELVPVCTGGGFNFWVGNWPEYHTSRWEWKHFSPPLAKVLKGKSEVEQDKVFMRLGVGYIKENPFRAAVIFARKFSYLWLGSLGTDPRMSGRDIPHIGGFGVPRRAVFYTPLYILSVLGWFLLPTDARKRAYPLFALLVCWTLSYVVTTAVPRYAVPMLFYELMLASWALWCALGLKRAVKLPDEEVRS